LRYEPRRAWLGGGWQGRRPWLGLLDPARHPKDTHLAAATSSDREGGRGQYN